MAGFNWKLTLIIIVILGCSTFLAYNGADNEVIIAMLGIASSIVTYFAVKKDKVERVEIKKPLKFMIILELILIIILYIFFFIRIILGRLQNAFSLYLTTILLFYTLLIYVYYVWKRI